MRWRDGDNKKQMYQMNLYHEEVEVCSPVCWSRGGDSDNSTAIRGLLWDTRRLLRWRLAVSVVSVCLRHVSFVASQHHLHFGEKRPDDVFFSKIHFNNMKLSSKLKLKFCMMMFVVMASPCRFLPNIKFETNKESPRSRSNQRSTMYEIACIHENRHDFSHVFQI